jgi:hypothetical protein
MISVIGLRNMYNDMDLIIDDFFSDLPLKEQVLIANMDYEDISILQSVFNLYIRSKIDSEPDDEMMFRLWERLQSTHKLRAVK